MIFERRENQGETSHKCELKQAILVKKPEPVADNPVLNSRDVALYYLSEEYKDCITYGWIGSRLMLNSV